MSLGLGIGLGGGGGAIPASPLTILSDVCCWLRGDNWTVSSFPDKSGKGNVFSQATPADQPTLTTSDANFGGQATATFNGTSQFMQAASFAYGAGPDFFIWAVARLLAAGSFPIIWSDGLTAHELRGSASSGEPQMNAALIATTATWGSSTVGATKAIAGWDQAVGQVGVAVSNGAAVTTSTTTHVVVDGTTPIIGARTGGSLFANMTLAEIVITSTMPSGAQLTALQAYGVARYGAI